MEENMKLEEFHTLMTSETEENQLIATLRALTKLGKPEDVNAVGKGTAASWTGWRI